MREWLRQWLGIEAQRKWTNQHWTKLSQEATELRGELWQLRRKIEVLESALGRILAKLEPTYAANYADPVVRAESDAIGAKILKRLADEAAVRNRHNT